MTKRYNWERKNRLAPRYRLKRRGSEVIKAIKMYRPSNLNAILDIGTADGLMLSRIKQELNQANCVGLEYSQELIDQNNDQNIKILKGDAQNLPFNDDTFDTVIATAVIEHLEFPDKMLKEAYRVLKRDGIIILTTPNPFFDKIANLVGHTEKEIHQTTFNLKDLKNYLETSNFKILRAERFMVSPIGMPYELIIERIIRFLKLDFIFLNQLIIGKK